MGCAEEAGAVFVEGGEVMSVLFVLYPDFASACEERPVSCVLCWESGVEAVDASGDGFDDVFWASDAHEVAWFFF